MVLNPTDAIRLELRRGTLIYAVLMALQQEAYGYSLRKRLNEEGLQIDEGTLYPLIRRLETQGYLESRWSDPSEGRKRKYYRLSNEGAALMNLLDQEWENLNQSIEQLKNHTQ